jgi:hypothetical protein
MGLSTDKTYSAVTGKVGSGVRIWDGSWGLAASEDEWRGNIQS